MIVQHGWWYRDLYRSPENKLGLPVDGERQDGGELSSAPVDVPGALITREPSRGARAVDIGCCHTYSGPGLNPQMNTKCPAWGLGH